MTDRCSRSRRVSSGFRTSSSGEERVGVTQVTDEIWLVSFMHYDLGYFDDETCRLEPIENPFGSLKPRFRLMAVAAEHRLRMSDRGHGTMAVFVGRSSMTISKWRVSDPSRTLMPSVSATVPRMRSPATQVPFLLPRSSIETSRPSTFSRAWWRDTESASI